MDSIRVADTKELHSEAGRKRELHYRVGELRRD